ncbi:MAG: hypothetical protein HY805_05480 [Nitrospirae bacterium]|nr:hypothetical protein [Nitrospirota bacterium]
MGIRAKFEEKIKRKEQEIQEYEGKIREAKAYLQALQDSLKLLPREGKNVSIESILRPGSNIAKTYEFLKKIGKPLHITEILKGIGKSTSKKDRIALSGSLGWYVRRKEIFTRPAPNTFGLIESGEEPPEDFGLDKKEEKESNVDIEPF